MKYKLMVYRGDGYPSRQQFSRFTDYDTLRNIAVMLPPSYIWSIDPL